MKINTRHNKSQIILIVFWGILLLLIAPEIVFSKTSGADLIEWEKIDTRHTIIYYQSSEDLEKFNTKINFCASPKKSGLSNAFSDKIDELFKRSQQLLGMHGFLTNIKIKVFKNKQQLDNAYYKIYKKKSNARAWYTHEELTVFIQLNDIFEGMLAHEFAHAIIDHFMIVPPPVETAEILAKYVDTHLVDSITTKPGNEINEPTHARGYSAK